MASGKSLATFVITRWHNLLDYPFKTNGKAKFHEINGLLVRKFSRHVPNCLNIDDCLERYPTPHKVYHGLHFIAPWDHTSPKMGLGQNSAACGFKQVALTMASSLIFDGLLLSRTPFLSPHIFSSWWPCTKSCNKIGPSATSTTSTTSSVSSSLVVLPRIHPMGSEPGTLWPHLLDLSFFPYSPSTNTLSSIKSPQDAIASQYSVMWHRIIIQREFILLIIWMGCPGFNLLQGCSHGHLHSQVVSMHLVHWIIGSWDAWLEVLASLTR